MKNLKTLCVIAGLLCFATEASAQFERANSLSTEVLVFIMQDSLELAPALRFGANVQQSDIRSQQLRTTLESANVRSIARAFPDWDETRRVSYNDAGERVTRPEFHRIFTPRWAKDVSKTFGGDGIAAGLSTAG